MDSVTAKSVKKELARLVGAVNGDYRYHERNAGLDRFADSLRFEGATLLSDDSIEKEEALDILSHFGNDSYARYLYGD
ncbi:MAG: hypothetical protein PHF67_05300 [Candidatus Nanoarchaeia archaeon]|nr:hypothetical protein [Candidatus Nanoarchaeia archaeon]